jgi:hypothetical protein
VRKFAGKVWLLVIAGILVVGVVVLGATFAGWPGAKPPLPPLLQSVTAGGGLWGACPTQTPEAAAAREGRPVAFSPELDQRLVKSFPPGSSEARLVDTLRMQGFELLAPCTGDSSIHLAAFIQHGGGVISPPMTANIYWKVDERGNILWIKGFVRYLAL